MNPTEGERGGEAAEAALGGSRFYTTTGITGLLTLIVIRVQQNNLDQITQDSQTRSQPAGWDTPTSFSRLAAPHDKYTLITAGQ